MGLFSIVANLDKGDYQPYRPCIEEIEAGIRKRILQVDQVTQKVEGI